jgi:hypothetical protein
MAFRSIKPLLLAISLGLSGAAAMASGSDGVGSAETGDAQAYNIGKMVYFQKLACSGCTLAGKKLDASLAREIISGKVKVMLAEDESRALRVYLSRRFSL